MIFEVALSNGISCRLISNDEISNAEQLCDYLFSREYVIANERVHGQQTIIPTRAIQAVMIVTDEWEVEEG